MDEILKDYYDSQREKTLARPKAAIKFGAAPPARMVQEPVPVVIVQYPHLATLPERLRYLQRKETVAAFSKRCGVSLKAYSRLLHGARSDTHLLKKIADAAGCPLDWLQGQKEESTPMEEEKLPQMDTFSERLTWARERKKMTVQMLCNEIGWPKFKYHRIRGGRQLLHRDAAERLAQILEVPEEWLTAGVAVAQRETTRKSQPEGSMPKKANPMRLHIAGTYTSEQLASILAGLGGRSFAVELELREFPN